MHAGSRCVWQQPRLPGLLPPHTPAAQGKYILREIGGLQPDGGLCFQARVRVTPAAAPLPLHPQLPPI